MADDARHAEGAGNDRIAASVMNPPRNRQIGETWMIVPHLGEKRFRPLQGHRWFKFAIPVHGCI